MPITAGPIEYHAAGVRYVGHLAGDETRPGRRPGVLVIPDGLGLNRHVRRVGEQLARLGYVALAVDCHGDGKRYSLNRDLDQVLVRVQQWISEPDEIRTIGVAALVALARQRWVDPDCLAAIGYSYGGTMALELARSGADLKAVVGIHSSPITIQPHDAARISASVLVLVGAEDPVIPPEARAAFEREMSEAGVDWRLVLYGGIGHSFTHVYADGSRPGLVYDAVADRRSWRATIDHLAEAFASVHKLEDVQEI